MVPTKLTFHPSAIGLPHGGQAKEYKAWRLSWRVPGAAHGGFGGRANRGVVQFKETAKAFALPSFLMYSYPCGRLRG
jgi:hypothetical protein